MQRNKFGDVYYTLIGGGVESNETFEEALQREVLEETGLVVRPGTEKHVFTHAIEPYGIQYVFTCEIEPGEPVLGVDSEEAVIHAEGKNLYTPMWLPLDQLLDVPFRSRELAEAVTQSVKEGFPSEPIQV
jgi:8-oxo-dGTP pyrophosphatase MutT (NUDIX family)